MNHSSTATGSRSRMAVASTWSEARKLLSSIRAFSTTTYRRWEEEQSTSRIPWGSKSGIPRSLTTPPLSRAELSTRVAISRLSSRKRRPSTTLWTTRVGLEHSSWMSMSGSQGPSSSRTLPISSLLELFPSREGTSSSSSTTSLQIRLTQEAALSHSTSQFILSLWKTNLFKILSPTTQLLGTIWKLMSTQCRRVAQST